MLDAIMRDLKPSPSAYLSVARQIEAEPGAELRVLNVAILSSFTLELLRPYLVVEGARRGMLVRPFFAPFNQLEQEVLVSDSSLYASKPEVVVLATRLEEIGQEIVTRFMSLSPADIEREIGGVEDRLRRLVQGVRRITRAKILVFNYAYPEFLAAPLADASLEISQTSVIQHANDCVARICREVSDVYVFDFARVVCEFGLRRWYDHRLWYMGRIPFGAEAQLETGRQLARWLRAACFSSRKCLVVDLDNTLWGGVLGEDGMAGIALGEDYPGNAYKDFQRRVLSLREQGVLIAVASKNNEPDVLEVFQKHADCLLKIEDFAAFHISWQDKATSLVDIAKKLNIDTDALAFFDDSPVEREWVRARLPEVNVIEVPESPLGFIKALEESGAFDSLVVSEEDRKRAEMYQIERQRKQLQAQDLSIEEFLKQLQMTISIGYVGANTLPRVAQLLAKTNQFNLTTRRHSSSEVQAMIQSGAVALWLRVADRFGDNGLVGVAIAVPRESGQWLVDSFLLSCRVIGRKVETALLSILSDVIRKKGGKVLLGEFIPSPKNAPASGFYAAHDFEACDCDRRLWKWDLSKGEIPRPALLEVRFVNDSGQ